LLNKSKVLLTINSSYLFLPNLDDQVNVETQFNALSPLYNEAIMRFKIQYPERAWFIKLLNKFPLGSSYISEPLTLDLFARNLLKPSRFVGGFSTSFDSARFAKF